MADQIVVLVPGKGMLVRDPLTKKVLLEKGEPRLLVGPEGRYWRRRIQDGSVTVKTTPSAVRYSEKRRN